MEKGSKLLVRTFITEGIKSGVNAMSFEWGPISSVTQVIMDHLVIGISRLSKNVLPHSFPVCNTFLLFTVSFPCMLYSEAICCSL